MARFHFERQALRAAFLVCAALGIASDLPSQAQTASSPSAGSMNDKGAKTPAYNLVSIKPDTSTNGASLISFPPDGFVATNVPLYSLVQNAYKIVMDSQVSGVPDWARSDLYDIEARVDAQTAQSWKTLSPRERLQQEQPMLQSILAEKCQFKAHQETKEMPVYDLVIAKGGLKMNEAPPDENTTDQMTDYTLIAHAMSIGAIADALSEGLGRFIFDKTGVTDKKFDFNLNWTPDASNTNNAANAADLPPSLFTALKEQLGLKLVPSKAPVEVLVIDQMEKPSAN
jgi:uncharacterized protein (TIGR03435 family)